MATINPNDIRLANPSSRTIAERNKFAGQLDDFTTFRWGSYDMFTEFGAFIINEKKGSLKMYNGASYKNNYTKQQFQDGYSNLTGITFDTQQISFVIGVYWISIEDYRVLMNLFHPYAVEMLSFSFEPTYGYQCKLTAIKDSVRHIVGKETISTSTSNNFSRLEGSDQSGYRYYTELNLTFEVIGKQCAKEITPQIISAPIASSDNIYTIQPILIQPKSGQNNLNFISDLEYPISLSFSNLSFTNLSNTSVKCQAYLKYGTSFERTETLFEVQFKNLESTDRISLFYDSEAGLLYWSLGDKRQLLTLLSTLATGERFVKTISVKQFFWPGRLSLPLLNSSEIGNWEAKIQFTGTNTFNSGVSCTYNASRRTNVI